MTDNGCFEEYIRLSFWDVAFFTGLLILFCILLFAKTAANKSIESLNTQDLKSDSLDYIYDNAIHNSYPSYQADISRKETGSRPIRTSVQVSEEALRQYLMAKNSPLSDYTVYILQSSYWSTIVAITAAEQSFYKQPTTSPYNLWGMMKPGGERAGLRKFDSFEQAISYMDNYFAILETKGRTTIESLRGYYCASACTNWESTVIKVKNEVENL